MEGVLFIRGAYKAPERGCWYIYMFCRYLSFSFYFGRTIAKAVEYPNSLFQKTHQFWRWCLVLGGWVWLRAAAPPSPGSVCPRPPWCPKPDMLPSPPPSLSTPNHTPKFGELPGEGASIKQARKLVFQTHPTSESISECLAGWLLRS